MLLSGQVRPPKARPWSSCSGLRAGRWHVACPWRACSPPPAGATGPAQGTQASSTQPDAGSHRRHGKEDAKQPSHAAKLDMPPVQRQEQPQQQPQRQRRWQQPRPDTMVARAASPMRAAAGAEHAQRNRQQEAVSQPVQHAGPGAEQQQARPSALRSLVAKITGAGSAAAEETRPAAGAAVGAPSEPGGSTSQQEAVSQPAQHTEPGEGQQPQARSSMLRSLVAKITGAEAAAQQAAGSDAAELAGAAVVSAAERAPGPAVESAAVGAIAVSVAERTPEPTVESAAAEPAVESAAAEPAGPSGSGAQQGVVSPAAQHSGGGMQQPQARPTALRSLVAKIREAGAAAEPTTGSDAAGAAAEPATGSDAAGAAGAAAGSKWASGTGVGLDAEVAAEPGDQAPLSSPLETPVVPSSSQPAATAARTAAEPPAAVAVAQQKPPASSQPAPLASSMQIAAPAQQLASETGVAPDAEAATRKQPPVSTGAAGKAGGAVAGTDGKPALQPRAARAVGRQPRVRWHGKKQAQQHQQQQQPDKVKQGMGPAAVPTDSDNSAAGQEDSAVLAAGAAAVGTAASASRQLPHPSKLASPEALLLLHTLGMAEGQLQGVVAAAHAAFKDRSALLSEEGVRQACTFLTEELKLPVGKVPLILEGAPEVLGVGLDELRRRARLLSTLWRGRSSTLLRSLQAQPELLTQAFFVQLGACLEALVSLGFNREQACRAVAKCPRIVHRRRYELASALHKAGFKLEGAQKPLFDFLAAHPQLMMPSGFDELQPLVTLLAEFGLHPEEVAAAVEVCPALLRTRHDHMRSVVNLLRSSGFRQPDVAAVLRGFPAVLVSDLQRVRSVLLLMRTAGVPLAAVVAYPRIFYHHPANCIAPRLAYLKAHKPGRVESLALASITSRSDAEFAETKGQIPVEEYLVFKDRWLSLYGHRLGLTPEQAAPKKQELRRQLAKEVAGQLFSPIDWDNV